MKSFPLFLATSGQRIVILGGGEQAAQKARLIQRTEAELVLMAPSLCPELRTLVATGRARHVPSVIDRVEILGARLIFAATGCAGADAAAAAIARSAGVLVNVVDRPELCEVTTPAIVDRNPVIVAIGTEGTAPVLARQIKARVEELLEPSLGGFAALAGRLRAQVARHVAPARRRAFWDWAFAEPRRRFTGGDETAAQAEIAAALAAGGAPGQTRGRVSLVGAGPGGADMITLRGVQRLQTADVILHDRLVDPAVLELARRDAERIEVGKTPGRPSWSQDRINRLMVAAAAEGRQVVRLKCGDPGIFGRGAEEAAALDAAGIDWEIVAGVTAASAAAAEARLFLTEREEIRSITLATGQGAEGSAPDWAGLARAGSAVAFYMGVATAGRIRREMLAAGVPPETPVEILEKAGRPDRRHIPTTVEMLERTIHDNRVQNPAILLLRWKKSATATGVSGLPVLRTALSLP